MSKRRRESFIEHVLPNPFRKWTPLEMLRVLTAKGKPSFKPGESLQYSNTNCLQRGLLIAYRIGPLEIIPQEVTEDNVQFHMLAWRAEYDIAANR